jgi:lysophospholipase L1-like esterase
MRNLFVILFSLLCIGAAPRIMFIGDSQIVGTSGDATDRLMGMRDHWQDAVGIGKYDIVGSKTDPGSDGTYDVDHEGVGGETLAQIEARLDAALDAYMPTPNPPHSIVYIHGGGNDCTQDLDLAASAANVGDMIDMINTHDPEIDIYIGCQIMPRYNGDQSDADTLNANILAVVKQKQATKSNLYCVDQETSFLADPDPENNLVSGDGVHLNDTGYNMMADNLATDMTKVRLYGITFSGLTLQ